MAGRRGTSLVLGGALLLTVLTSGTALAEGDGVPTIRSNTEGNGVWLTDWPAGTEITVVVDTDWSFTLGDGSTYLQSATATADGAGQATIQFDGTGVTLRPGHRLTAIGGPTTKQLLVPELRAYVDSETGEVFGTIGIADPVGDIAVIVFPGSSEEVFRHASAAATWSMNLAAAPSDPSDSGQMSLPLPQGLQGQVLFTDTDDDEAEIPWYIAWDGVFRDDDRSVFDRQIDWLALAEITYGCNPPINDRFCPTETVTRGQMAAFLVRALGLTDRLADPFVDDDGSVFEADAERLAAAGITRGCNPPVNDRFCPTERITRGQMAAFLVRALGYTDDGGGDLFVDDDDSIFEADIDRLATAKVTIGCNPPVNDRFCPAEPVTREQMAGFLNRALD